MKSDLNISHSKNEISISWNGAERLSGGLPKLENGKDSIISISELTTDSTHEFVFHTSESKEGIGLQIKEDTSSQTLLFSISPNGLHSKKGEDYIGLFFRNIPGYSIGTALYKYSPVKAWTHPVQVKEINDLNAEDNQFYIWKYSDSTYAVAAPLAGSGYVACLGRDSNSFGAKSRSYFDNATASNVPVLAIAYGKNPYQVIQNLYETSLKFMGRGENLRKNKTYPVFFESIGWCTWNAFMHEVNQEKILQGLTSFKENGVVIPNLIIDDGWMQVNGGWGLGALSALEVNKDKFPQGLASFVSKVKQQYQVKEVGVWHAFNGYWSGIDSNSALWQKYKTSMMAYEDRVTWGTKPNSTFYMPTAHNATGAEFYNDWYAYLKGEGISFVKVDNQLIGDRIVRNNMPFWDGASQAHANVHGAIQKYFDGTVLNCMDMTVDAAYNFGTSAIARTEEDYFPHVTDYKMTAGNAAIHVLCAGYNSLWFSPMVWPDYDMFETYHPNAKLHAAARAISGGPVYITDIPGKQNFDIIKSLTSSDGKIYRTDVPALPTEDCLFQVSDSVPFKLFSYVGNTGLILATNAANTDQVTGSLKPSDVPNLKGESFLVYEHFSGKYKILGMHERLPLTLKRMDAELYYIVPVTNGAALVGLADKYNAPKTITRADSKPKNLEITIKEHGRFVAYLEAAPKSIVINGTAVAPSAYKYSYKLLTLDLKKEMNKNGYLINIELASF